MNTTEIFKNPTVMQVIFQITFPSYFSIENKIGDFQLKVMEKLPISNLLLQNQLVFVNSNNNGFPNKTTQNEPSVKKIWQFQNRDEEIILNITDSSLDITSEKHKTYNNDGGGANKFREFVAFVVDHFLEIINIPFVNRVGLRYIDNCPLPAPLTSTSFSEYYNTCFNLHNIFIDNSIQYLTYHSLILNEDIFIKFSESLIKESDKFSYEMDFDGSINNIKSGEYLSKLDLIHNEISESYLSKIKEPVKTFMRQ